MKDFKNLYLSASLVLLLFASFVEADGDFSWKHDGSISDTVGHNIIINMKNIYDAQEYHNNLFLIGYKIDKSGINYPTVTRVSSNLKKTDYWSFDCDLNDLFVYRDKIYIADSNGAVYSLKKSNWIKSPLKLNPNSSVIFSNGDIVACYPSPFFKEDKGIGACYSIEKKWKVTVNWQDLTPAICHGFLYVYENNYDGGVVKKINLDTGKVQNAKRMTDKPDRMCDISF